jgi:hypothetical protein
MACHEYKLSRKSTDSKDETVETRTDTQTDRCRPIYRTVNSKAYVSSLRKKSRLIKSRFKRGSVKAS